MAKAPARLGGRAGGRDGALAPDAGIQRAPHGNGEASRSRRTRGLATLVIALVSAAYAILAGLVLNPRTFFNGDAGVKYLQADNAAQSHWRSLAVRNPAADIDPERRFSALAGNQFSHREGGPDYGAYSELFVVPVSLALALFGPRGMYLVPGLAAVLTLILTYRLALRTAPRAAWVAPLLVGACSPILFYAVELWEHTPAVCLSTAAVLLVVGAGDVRRFLLAGLAIGLAIATREEMYAMLPAGLVALAWVERRRRLPMAAAAAAGAVLALLPHWLLVWSHTGMPGRIGLARLLGFAVEAPQTEAIPASMSKLPLIEMIVPHSLAWTAAIAVALLARLALPRVDRALRPWLLLALAFLTLAWAGAVGVSAVLHAWRPDSVLRVFPAALFLLFVPISAGPPSPRRRDLAQILAIAATFTAVVCIVAPFGGVQNRQESGGPEWGPRLLLPIYPLLATGIAAALEQRHRWQESLRAAPGLLVALFIAVASSGLAVQARGMVELNRAKDSYERLVAATEAVDGGDVVVTTLWWFAAVVAPVLYQHQVVSVDVAPNGSLPELLARLDERGITRLTFVTEGTQPSPAQAEALARAGWFEAGSRRVSLWLEVGLLSFRRDPARSLGRDAAAPALRGSS